MVSKKRTTRLPIQIELPSVPNFPYNEREVEPPKNVVLILATESGYMFGEWDGVYYFDQEHRKIEAVYGSVVYWCPLIGVDGKVVFTGE